ncbi:MAG: alpha/beta fold hydrolase, partial [Candidatus Dormibacteria bacterium]
WYMWFFQLRGIYEMVVSADDCAVIENIWHDWSPGLAIDARDMAHIRAMLSRPEVFEAAMGYYRCTVDGTLQSDDLNEAQMATTGDNLGAPVLFVAGADDGLFIPEHFHEGADYCTAGCRVEVLDNCGHWMHLERPDDVNRLVLDFVGAAVPAPAG